MRLTLSLFLALVVVSLAVRPMSGQATDDPALRAAQHRQDVVKTVYIEFKQVEVIVKGGVSEGWPAGMFKTSKPVPDEETTLESRNRFVIDGEKNRYEDNHPTWYMPDGILKKRSLIAFSNGVSAKHFAPHGLNGDRGPVGGIEKGPKQRLVKSQILAPITMAFRGDDPSISPYTLSEMKPTGQTSLLGRLPCREYAIDYSPEVRATFLLDPEKDYLARRVKIQKKGHITEQTDVEYRPHDVAGWVPSAWVVNNYSTTGNTLSTTRAEILELRLNDAQPADLFDIQFPPDTHVINNGNGKEYIVKADGSMRELRGGEELPGAVFQLGTPWYRRHQWLLVFLALALAVMVVGAIWAKRKRHNP